ncbi:uncharacterized protein YecE (DUF72 family) [Saccharothrix tamanrassetensis]|uniref:Uncharacterized protein YecE (DUF72 family) n=1 Tax=Saccharothrix tamanrassetensis TaxID=1051531 RepID=A0A841CII0_9PSEU|nr:DUF72 domain-containing protein [Saccharothrix tamanrassetensis]MBB5958312.1 uncharacterized protein YecE (DUF72 family) [Saccharothrix tamanrassetensis]
MIHVGTSGWVYPPWRGVFYPKGLPQKRELEYLSRQVGSVEINGTFYALQRPSSFQAWSAQTPDDFVFAVKGSRFITHMKRLRDPQDALGKFFDSGMLGLGRKLGPFLWQLPPTLRYDPDLLALFFDALPRAHEGRPLRHALEVRHESFRDPGFLPLLRAHDIALVIADTAQTFIELEAVTTDFVYIRLHGDEELYVSGYTDQALDRWAAKIRDWARDHDVYAYFDNDAKVMAPKDAMALSARLRDA